MDLPLSTTAANVVMEEIEEKVLKKVPYRIIFYCRHVDDTLICLPRDKIKDILSRFNDRQK